MSYKLLNFFRLTKYIKVYYSKDYNRVNKSCQFIQKILVAINLKLIIKNRTH